MPFLCKCGAKSLLAVIVTVSMLTAVAALAVFFS